MKKKHKEITEYSLQAEWEQTTGSETVYHSFLAVMLAYADALSLLYPGVYPKEESPAQKIEKALRPFLMFEKRMPENGETMRFYRIDGLKNAFDLSDVLETAKSMWDWELPVFPGDLSFYKKGYTLFRSSAKNRVCRLYPDAAEGFLSPNEMASIGITMKAVGKIRLSEVL